MRNLKVLMAYNGTRYNGYQSQPCGNTVQDIVENRASRLLNQPISINGCSRTDAGVHAKEFCFNFHMDEKISTIGCDAFVKAMNAMLPADIAILSCEEADENFHARFDSKGKEYMYLVDNSKIRDVFSEKLALHYPYPLDEKRMNNAAGLLVGTHDFGSFCKAEAKQHLKTTVRTLHDFRVERCGENVKFYVRGDGFLHNMVRILVGTLIYVNENKRSEQDILRSLESDDREAAGKTLPPWGLYLNKVFY